MIFWLCMLYRNTFRVLGYGLRNLLFLVIFTRNINSNAMCEGVSQVERVELLSTPKSYSVCRCVRTYKLLQVMRKYVLVSRHGRVGRRAARSGGGVRNAAVPGRARSAPHHRPLDRRQLQPVPTALL